MPWDFEEGRVYNRRRDIHAVYGGQQQGGISTPSGQPLVILITGEEGKSAGYADRLRDDGVFEYFGEGQVGDMAMTHGNKHIRDHAENGRDLLLFRKTRDGLRFEGQYVYEDHHIERAPDSNDDQRDAIVFELRPMRAVETHLARHSDETLGRPEDDLKTLRHRAISAARSEPRRGERKATVIERTAAVKDYVFARAKGRCEDCGEGAPFFTPGGRPFLEAHHIRRLTDGGPDDPRFVIALCPNCHRRAHYGRDAKARNEEMQAYVTAIESAQQ